MGRLLPILFFVDVALVVIALISCLSAEDSDIRALPRYAWVLIILLFPPVGPIAWFVAGKERYSQPRQQHWAPGRGFPESERPEMTRGRPVAPDDNPDFLRGIAVGNAQRDAAAQEKEREKLRKWEEDLRRREDELRKRDNTDSQ
ncbi:MAG TPA: PLD nuclease N-terminal domain-containing protein [Candidatus Limnocylindrales bacterium]|nr:PLD nuclease N-terminal domain-containing protein [Candidatus Limnocylindrales bacterium]